VKNGQKMIIVGGMTDRVVAFGFTSASARCQLINFQNQAVISCPDRPSSFSGTDFDADIIKITTHTVTVASVSHFE
jgi:hypothetical protein